MKHSPFLLAAIFSLYNTLAKSSDGIIKEFNDYINQSISDANIAGMAVAIVSGDSILFSQGYGYVDIQTKEPFTPHTVMNIASITKTFVGVSVMHLVEKGVTNLDDDVNHILPFNVQNPNSPESVITLRHIMSHMSGIRDNLNVYLITMEATRQYPWKNFLKIIYLQVGNIILKTTLLRKNLAKNLNIRI